MKMYYNIIIVYTVLSSVWETDSEMYDVSMTSDWASKKDYKFYF